METKPRCKLTGTDGNIFILIGRAAKALKGVGQRDRASEMSQKCLKSNSYHEALGIIEEYVDVS